MAPRYGRRVLLVRSAAAGVAALLAACGGSSGSQSTVSGGATSATGTPTTSSAATTVSTAIVPATATVGQSGATVRATAGAPVAGAGLARMLAFVPDQADLVRDGITITDLAAAKALHGLADVRSNADLQAKQIAYEDFVALIRGCILSDRMGSDFSDTDFRSLAGYDLFQIDREIVVGHPDSGFSRLEGAFDSAAIGAALGKGGYTPATYGDTTFLTVRGDTAEDAGDPLSSDVGAALNRVIVDDMHIASAPTTALIHLALDTEAKRTPTLAGNPTWQALLDAFHDVLSMATFIPTDFADPRLSPGGRIQVQTWGTLHGAELTAMGYTEDGKGQRVMHAARVYGELADANADAAELVRRIHGYSSLQTRQPIVPSIITGVTSRVLTSGGKGVLIADMPLAPPPVPASMWSAMLANKDTLYLADGHP